MHILGLTAEPASDADMVVLLEKVVLVCQPPGRMMNAQTVATYIVRLFSVEAHVVALEIIISMPGSVCRQRK